MSQTKNNAINNLLIPLRDNSTVYNSENMLI